MTPIQQIFDPYLSSLTLGILYGLTFCSSSCLPHIVSYIAGVGAGFRRGVISASIYSWGRITAYAALGGVTVILKASLSESFFASLQKNSSIVFSFVTILIGLYILLKGSFLCGECSLIRKQRVRSISLLGRIDLGAFILGFARGLVVCPPLVALLLTSLTFPQTNSIALAVFFGVGTSLSPMVIVAGATGWLLNKATMFSRWLSRIGGGALLLMGVITLTNFMK